LGRCLLFLIDQNQTLRFSIQKYKSLRSNVQVFLDLFPSIKKIGSSLDIFVWWVNDTIIIALRFDFWFDGNWYLHKDLIVLALDIAKRTYNNGVKLTNQRFKYPMISFISFCKIVINSVEEVYEKIVGIMLRVSSELNKKMLTGLRL